MTNNSQLQKLAKADVAIILGSGVDQAGNLTVSSKERLQEFLKYRKRFIMTPILLSGRWSGLIKIRPKLTGAKAMQKYLTQHGIAFKYIYLEDMSLDTIGNALFCKQIIKKHKQWQHLLIITSDWHIKRVKWIFQKVFNRQYKLAFLPALSKLGSTYRQRLMYERYLLKLAKQILEDVCSGDDREIFKTIKKYHHFYSKSKQAQERLKDVIINKEKFIGQVKEKNLFS